MSDTRLTRLIEAAEAAVHTDHPASRLAELMAGVARDRAAVLSYLPGAGLDEHVLYASSSLTLLRVEAPPGMCYPPHEHRMHAAIAVLDGEECNTYYRESDDGLRVAGKRRSTAGELVRMDVNVIHAVSNLGDVRTVGLHAYTGDLFATPRTLWDPRTGEKHFYTDELYFALAWRTAITAGAQLHKE